MNHRTLRASLLFLASLLVACGADKKQAEPAADVAADGSGSGSGDTSTEGSADASADTTPEPEPTYAESFRIVRIDASASVPTQLSVHACAGLYNRLQS